MQGYFLRKLNRTT